MSKATNDTKPTPSANGEIGPLPLSIDHDSLSAAAKANTATLLANAFSCGLSSTVEDMIEHAHDELVILGTAISAAEREPAAEIVERFLCRIMSTLTSVQELYRREHEELIEARAKLRALEGTGAAS